MTPGEAATALRLIAGVAGGLAARGDADDADLCDLEEFLAALAPVLCFLERAALRGEATRAHRREGRDAATTRAARRAAWEASDPARIETERTRIEAELIAAEVVAFTPEEEQERRERHRARENEGTREAKEQFLSLYREGLTCRESCQRLGRSTATVHRWFQADPAFRSRYDDLLRARGGPRWHRKKPKNSRTPATPADDGSDHG